jgi:hypothetical protein
VGGGVAGGVVGVVSGDVGVSKAVVVPAVVVVSVVGGSVGGVVGIVVSVVGGSVGGVVGIVVSVVGGSVGGVVGRVVVVVRGGRGGRVVTGDPVVPVVGAGVAGLGLLGAAVRGGEFVTGGSGLRRIDVVPRATTPARTAALTGRPVVGTAVLLDELVVVLAGAVTENVNGAKTGATRVLTSSSEREPGAVVGPAVSSVLTLTPSFGLLGRASPTTPAPKSAAAAPNAQSTRLRVLGSLSSSAGCGAGSDSGGSKTGGWREPSAGRGLPPPSSFPGIPACPTIASLPLSAARVRTLELRTADI